MRRLMGPTAALACLLFLVGACFWGVLFRGEQFAYRDAAHYYYPLYERVQQEWAKGRLPLWDARENAGMPLLGNPTAAVLYPGKLIYAALPYPWAARAYILAHVLLALAGMYRLARTAGTSPAGSWLAAMSYAFGSPVLFQYCNVIYLVGAAWVPWGLAAADGWIRRGRRMALLGLALVLVMQVLGGEPQVAYGLGLCAGGYAIGVAAARRRPAIASRGRGPGAGTLAAIVLAGWVAAVLVCAVWFPAFRPPRANPPSVALPWSRFTPMVVAGLWASGAVLWLAWRRSRDRVLPTMFGGLALAAVLAGAISAAQLIPVLEYTGRTIRAAQDGPHDIFPFSVEPYRLAEFLWPDLFGTAQETNRAWGSLLPPRHTTEIWVPSLYIGVPVLLLALSSLAFRGADPRRAWFSAIAVLGVAASLGEFGGPLWIARNLPGAESILGGHDPMTLAGTRLDGKLRDGDGSIYSLMATFLPGFGSFRYPSKLLTFACAGLAALAGMGFDLAREGGPRRWRWPCGVVLAAGLAGWAASEVGHRNFVEAIRAANDEKALSPFGPLDYEGAWRSCRDALRYGALATLASLLAFEALRRWPLEATVAVLTLVAADLARNNGPLIVTVPQATLEGKPELLRKIEEAERLDPSPGPYRVHRLPYWDPLGWGERSSSARHREMVEWERKTIQPKYAIPYGLSYTMTLGVGELYDFEWFFMPFYGNAADPTRRSDPESNPQLIYFPRRGFDLWNTRYFVLPARTSNDERRAIFSFLPETEPIYPDSRSLPPADWERFFDRWSRDEDWQLVKNRAMFPRAWVVHRASYAQPVVDLGRAGREDVMTKILYQADRHWTDSRYQVYDLRRMAFVETAEPAVIDSFLSGAGPDREETVEVVSLDDVEVVLRARLKSNGLVILSDVDYPGWELTIDDRPATIHRVNRLMRGAAVPAGEHRLVYRYRPRSVRIGFAISVAGLAALAVLGIAFAVRPTSPRLAPSPTLGGSDDALTRPLRDPADGAGPADRLGPGPGPTEGPARPG